MRRSRWFAILALSFAANRANAQVYNAVNDFSLASNPSGAWRYGTLSSFTSGNFSLNTAPSSTGGFATWGNGGSVPNNAGVTKNTTSGTLTSGTVVLPPDLLNLDGENFIADVRWVAPAAGLYNVSGRFQRTDNGGVPVSVRIVQDGLATLFSADNFSTFNDQRSFSLNVVLPAGSVLDFAEGAPQFNNDGTGLAATISPVPEPGTLALCGLVAAGGWLLRRKKGHGTPAILGAIALTVLLTPAAGRAQIVFSDGTFNDSDWTVFLYTGNGTVAAQQIPTGGNPDQYRRVDHQDFSGVLEAYHLRNGAFFNPAIPIISLNWSEDQIAIQNLFGIGIALRPALKQNGKYYDTRTVGVINNDPSWVTLSLPALTANDFSTIADSNDHPDFSATGGLIQFGFNTANNNGSFTVSRAAGFDNWSITVNTVPEPGTLVLCGLAVAGLIGYARRHPPARRSPGCPER